MDDKVLRKLLIETSLKLRQSQNLERPSAPRYISYDNIRLPDGTVSGRKKVIIMSSGCSIPTCTMCPFTNENNFGFSANSDKLLNQVTNVLQRTVDEPDYDIITLYNDGSFFATKEISKDTQISIAKLVAESKVKRLVVESLPQFVTHEILEPFVNALGTVELEIGIGLQSSDDLVRETLVNTRVTKPSFEKALTVMKELGVHTKIYLMIKPPFLTDEEAITDVIQSVDYVNSLGVKGVTLCPTRVARNTVAWKLLQLELYQPPNLWTVIDAVQAIHEKTSVRVACINLRGNDFNSIFPESCPKCADLIVDSLVSYSESGDISSFPKDCECRPKNKPIPLNHDEIIARTLKIVESEKFQSK